MQRRIFSIGDVAYKNDTTKIRKLENNINLIINQFRKKIKIIDLRLQSNPISWKKSIEGTDHMKRVESVQIIISIVYEGKKSINQLLDK